MKLPSKEQIAAYREGCYSHKKPEGNKSDGFFVVFIVKKNIIGFGAENLFNSQYCYL